MVHSSFVDGPGIRTTVFLKGCPLRCLWCCNPESQSMQPELQIIPEHCSGCGKCVSACPRGALRVEAGMVAIQRNLCDGCGACTQVCWPGALNVYGTLRTAEDVFEECLRDAAFYKSSGGGVTLSGGEPTLQPEFCLEMLERCHQAGISVAVDTCGQVESELGLEVLRQADMLLFDVKGLDPQRHRENTGRDNRVIQQNLHRAQAWGKPVYIRYPVIPNHNQQEAEEIARLLAGLSCVQRVDLIPYHQFGTVKYAQLGRRYPLDEAEIPDEQQAALVDCFRRHGLAVQLGG